MEACSAEKNEVLVAGAADHGMPFAVVLESIEFVAQRLVAAAASHFLENVLKILLCSWGLSPQNHISS